MTTLLDFGAVARSMAALGQGQLGLRQAELQSVVAAGLDYADGLGIREAHVLARRAEQAADCADEVARLQQPCQIVQCRVRVRAAQGLHQGAERVVVLVALPVVAHGAERRGSVRVRESERDAPVAAGRGREEQLHAVYSLADVPAAACGKALRHTRLAVVLYALQLGGGVHRSPHRRQDVIRGHGLELKHRAPAQKRVVDVEVGVLGC